MLFDVQAALAEILSSPLATSATPATLVPEIAPVSQVSQVSRSQPAECQNGHALAGSQVSRVSRSQRPETPPPSRGDLRQIGHGAPAPSHDDAPPGAILHLSRYIPKPNSEGRPGRALPTHPATCALCGGADWTVAMTDMRGRALHVACWKAEGGKA